MPDGASGRAGPVARHAVRAVGLTPRVFEALVVESDRHQQALPTEYVATINQHVRGNHMYENWCPVIVECASGKRSVLHVDPLHIRQVRVRVRQELCDVQEKRARMLRRISTLRAELPKAEPSISAERLSRELREAEVRCREPLVRPLPPGTQHLLLFVEISAHMVQMELVCQHLKTELPKEMEAAGISMLSLVMVGGDSSRKPGGPRPEVVEIPKALSREGLQALDDWLDRLCQAQSAEVAAKAKRKKRGSGSTKIAPMARQLRRAITADALAGAGAALFVLCSPPADAEECEVLLRRSQFTLQIAGVLGGCPEDPEVCFERLVKVAAAGSDLHLWFGETYWTAFAEARQRQLECLRELMEEEGGSPTAALLGSGREVVSGSILELRLLERIMRECYVDEQRCDEELQLLTRLLARDLHNPEEIKMAMRPKDPRVPSAPRSPSLTAEAPELEEAPRPAVSTASTALNLIDVAKVAMSSSLRNFRFEPNSADAG